MTQPTCSSQAHEEDHENLAKNECHRSCDSLDDVVARLDGLIDDDHSHDPLPYVTDSSSDLLNHASQPRTFPDDNALPDLGQLTNPHRHDYRAACQIALEGTTTWISISGKTMVALFLALWRRVSHKEVLGRLHLRFKSNPPQSLHPILEELLSDTRRSCEGNFVDLRVSDQQRTQVVSTSENRRGDTC